MTKRPGGGILRPLSVFIALASIAPFWPALHNGFVNWDDARNFLENPYYRGLGWTQLKWMFTSLFPPPYQPLSWVTLGVDYCLWGLNPMGYHLTNMILHAANAVLFFFIGVRLLAAARNEETDSPAIIRAAALSALLFAVHPLRVESVVWATERRDVLSGFFYLLTILSYLRLGREPAALRRLAAPLGFYLLSLFAKGMGITLPVVLFVLDVYPLRRLTSDPAAWLKSGARPYLWEKLPFGALALAFAVVGIVSQSRSGAVASVDAVGLAARLAQSAYGLVFYSWKTFLPVGLSPLYLRPVPLDPLAPVFALSGAVVVAAAFGAFLSRRRWPALAAAGVYYVATLSPVIGLIPLGIQLVADRYSYLACLVWPLLIAGAVIELDRRAVAGCAAAVLIALGAATRRQTHVWRDSESLWRRTLAIDAGNHVAHRNLAIALLNEGRLSDAVEEGQKAVADTPGYADGHTTLAQILFAQGRITEAVEQYSASLLTAPNDEVVRFNLGLALYQLGRWKDAIPQYRKALELNPKATNARVNLGAALIAGNRWGEAVDVYREAVALDPNDAGAHGSLGVALAASGRGDEGLAELDRALALRPNDPQILKNRTWIAEHLHKRTPSK